ncbi:MAG: adenylate/guanylate cyclase domain-containing protein, partial [Pseudomonadota bacterium]
SLQIATQDQSLAGQLSIRYAANLAMGTVIRVAETRLSHPVQVLLAPKSGSVSEALGQSWKEAGQDVTITIGAETRTSKSKTQDKRQTDRVLSAMLFADLFRFSDLDHAQTLKTVESVLAPLAEILQSFSNRLHHLNSWGDGIFAAFEKVEDAADAALAMQSRMQQLDLAALGLPSYLNLRIGAHYGPVSVGADPLTGRTTLYGSQVAQAAKIEPLAVPGSILVSEAFASALALSGRRDRATSYIGKHQLNALEKEVRLFALVPSATVH